MKKALQTLLMLSLFSSTIYGQENDSIPPMGQEAESGEITRGDLLEALGQIQKGLQNGETYTLKGLDYAVEDKVYISETWLDIELKKIVKERNKNGKIVNKEKQKEINELTIINRLESKKEIEINFSEVELLFGKVPFYRMDLKTNLNNLEGKFYGISLIRRKDKKTLVQIVSKGKNPHEDIGYIYQYLRPYFNKLASENTEDVLVMCNGEAKGEEKGNYTYWGLPMLEMIKKELKTEHLFWFKNADYNTLDENEIYTFGREEGKSDYEVIKKRLGSKGRLKFISHSKGSSFCVGYIEGLKSKYEGLSFPIDFHVMLAPYEFNDWEFDVSFKDRYLAIRHEYDWVSSFPKPGDSNYSKMKSITMVSSPTNSASDFEKLVKKISNTLLKTNKMISLKNKFIKKSSENFDSSLETGVSNSITKNGELKIDDTLKIEPRIDTIMKITLADYLSKKDIRAFGIGLMLNLDDNHTIKGFYYELESVLSMFKAKDFFNNQKDLNIIKANIKSSSRQIINEKGEPKDALLLPLNLTVEIENKE